MKIKTRWWTLTLLVIGTLWLLGCGQKRTESQTSQESSQQAPPSDGAAGPDKSGDSIAPAETVAAIWVQIAAEQEKISAVIQSGQLREVHHLADGARGLVVALANRASVSSPEAAPRLKGLVEQATVSAGDLGAMGDAGNLKGAEMESAKLNAILDAIKATVKPE